MATQPSKLRSIAIIVIGALTIYIMMNFFTRPQKTVEKTSASMRNAPEMESVPGSYKDNERYIKLQEKNNQARAEEAKKSNQSSLPTLVNKVKEEKSDEEFFKDLMKKQQKPTDEKKSREEVLKKAQEDADKRLKDQQDRMDKLRKEQEEKRRLADQAKADQARNQVYAKDLDSLVNVMMGELNKLTSSYNVTPKQTYVSSGDKSLVAAEFERSREMSSKSMASTALPFYKAGTVIYGVIQTDYNSDTPGPILAKITSGPLAGSTLIGSATNPSSNFSDGIAVTFSTLVTPFGVRSQSINLTAVNPETYRSAVASSTNYHYAQRYGALILSGLVTQANSAASSSNGSSSNSGSSGSSSGSSSGNTTGSSSTGSSKTTSGGSNYSAVFSPVASDISSSLSKVSGRAPTYKIHQGTAVGLLFTNDFVLES